jgi:hypothetical protein
VAGGAPKRWRHTARARCSSVARSLLCGGAHQAVVQSLVAQLLHHACRAKARGLAVQHGLGHALGTDEAALLQRVEHGAQVFAFLHMGGELAFQLQP